MKRVASRGKCKISVKRAPSAPYSRFFLKLLKIVPNLFTLGNLNLGFFSILFSLSEPGDQDALWISGFLIFLAMLFDGADGYAARLLNARSELGAQLDSLADLTTFGIAPGAIMYSLVLHDYNQLMEGSIIPLGMLIAGIYPTCAAFRLARFNVVHADDEFAGLPSPVAGVIVALLPFVYPDIIPVHSSVVILVFLITAFLMVSTLRYSKPQVAFVRRFSRERLAILLLVTIGVLVFLGLRYGPQYAAAGLLTIVLIYMVTGIVSLIFYTIQELRM